MCLRIFLPASTTQGWTNEGELKILRAKSRVGAMTTNLQSQLLAGCERLLVEDGDTTQGTGFPFTKVAFKSRVEGIEKCPHDGDFKPWTGNALFVELIFDYWTQLVLDMWRKGRTLIIDDNGEESGDQKSPSTHISK